MSQHTAENILKEHQLRITDFRVKVLDLFIDSVEALSSNSIEKLLDRVDRITLYRTLKSFEDKGIIHVAVDGTDKVKYAMCHSGCSSHAHLDNHAHFRCNDCGKTTCLDEIPSPSVNIPEGYRVDSTYLIIEGVCQLCKA